MNGIDIFFITFFLALTNISIFVAAAGVVAELKKQRKESL